MTIPDTLHRKVQQVVADSIALVEKSYPDLNLPPLLITYKRSFTTAGWALCEDYHINFDPILLLAYPEAFIIEIVPHEVAHIITSHIHGADTQSHGKEWKQIMILMGLKPNRCHGLDVSISKRKMTSYLFTCECTTRHEYGARFMKKLMLTPHECNQCKATLIPAFPIVLPERMPSKVAFGTKMDKARWLIERYKSLPRNEILQKLIADASLTPSGASTYYQLLTK